MLHEEVFADIPEYPNYLVSSWGRVINKESGREIKQCKVPGGYCQTKMYKGGVQRGVSTHRLVAAAFLPDYAPGYRVVHKNQFRHDNAAVNLEMDFTRIRGAVL